jgi:hypothetical protein
MIKAHIRNLRDRGLLFSHYNDLGSRHYLALRIVRERGPYPGIRMICDRVTYIYIIMVWCRGLFLAITVV